VFLKGILQMLSGIMELHRTGVIHMDIKLDNILLVVKIRKENRLSNSLILVYPNM